MTLGTLVTGLSHIGLRVHDLARAQDFYVQLGFEHAWGPFGPDHVSAMRHRSGLEINFIVNAAQAHEPNVLMDVDEKHPGFTHIALQVQDLAAVEAALNAAGIAISGRHGEASVKAVFVRDPDGNVIELAAD